MTDPITDPLFSQFSADDRSFLDGIFKRFPKIGQNFERYLRLTPEQRVISLRIDSEKIQRAGWVKRGIENPESLRAHIQNVMYYAKEEAPEGIDGEHAQSMAMVHDMPEVIITDFTPEDKISANEKARLERLAIQVITINPAARAIMQEFIEQITPTSHWVYDVDKLDAVFVALQYEVLHPKNDGIFQEFFNYTMPKLKTEKGGEIATNLAKNIESHREEYRRHFQGSQKEEAVLVGLVEGLAGVRLGK